MSPASHAPPEKHGQPSAPGMHSLVVDDSQPSNIGSLAPVLPVVSAVPPAPVSPGSGVHPSEPVPVATVVGDVSSGKTGSTLPQPASTAASPSA